jgi:CARDB protein
MEDHGAAATSGMSSARVAWVGVCRGSLPDAIPGHTILATKTLIFVGHRAGRNDMRAHFKLPLAAGLVTASVMALAGSALAQPQPRQLTRPDLVIGDLDVEDTLPFVGGKQVVQGRPFRACYVVSNIGLRASGPFRVKGSGVFPNPRQDHAGLAPGQSREGCLQYPGIRFVGQGTRILTLKVDSRNVVAESNESNNTVSETVIVLPN